MTKKRVVMTGACGRIGSVLRKGLSGYEIEGMGLELDLHDLRTDRNLAANFQGAEVVIHLAWIRAMGPPRPGSSYLDELPQDNRSMENLELSRNVLAAAAEAGVGRVILASSVHADDYRGWLGPGLLSPKRIPTPTGPYGASKLVLEEQGRYYSTLGPEIVCVRFGAVTADDRPDAVDGRESRAWLSHRDCIELMNACIAAESVPGRFLVLYGVSDNEARIHDTSNPFGWQARDGKARVPGVRHFNTSPEEKARTRSATLEGNSGFAGRTLALLKASVSSSSLRKISRYEHGLQVATRALRDGADEETVVCALFHDVFSYFTSENHAAVAAEMLRPYVSQENFWTVKMHGEFLLNHALHVPEPDRRAREKYRDHPCFDRTVRFCDRWDLPSDDPSYDTLTLEVFEPMVRRIFARPPYAHEDRPPDR